MSVGLFNTLYCRAFVDELAHSGLRDVVVSPGSRSTPLALALVQHPGIKVWTNLDERSAAYFALGIAKAGGAPVAVLCTSGTAAANLFPAIIEARYARVPLVILTADRPPELRENGAPQAIDQVKLYGDHVKWYAEMALPEASDALLRYVRTVASRACATAASIPQGPVHLNFPFREPLLPEPRVSGVDIPVCDDGSSGFVPQTGMSAPLGSAGGRSDGRVYTNVSQGRRTLAPEVVTALARALGDTRRGLIVCGPQTDPKVPEAVGSLAARLGYPVLADALSGVRCGGHDRSLVVDAYDAFLRDAAWAAEHEPDVVLRFGAMPTSKPLLQFLQRHPDCRQVVIDEGDGWRDPSLLVTDMVYADPVLLCDALTSASHGPEGVVSDWAQDWLLANLVVREAIRAQLDDLVEPFEGKVFSELAELLPPGSTLYAGNSMPVRDLDTFLPSTGKPLHILSNRGANGIDGVVSSALGASVPAGGPVVLVIGDVSFYHDMNGLLAAKLHGLNLGIVLLNNDGGGIFSFLPQAEHPEHFEELFGTPHGLEFGAAVRMYGGRHAIAATWQEFRQAFQDGLAAGGLWTVEIRTERARNVALHRAITAEVSRALAGQRAVAGRAG